MKSGYQYPCRRSLTVASSGPAHWNMQPKASSSFCYDVLWFIIPDFIKRYFYFITYCGSAVNFRAARYALNRWSLITSQVLSFHTSGTTCIQLLVVLPTNHIGSARNTSNHSITRCTRRWRDHPTKPDTEATVDIMGIMPGNMISEGGGGIDSFL